MSYAVPEIRENRLAIVRELVTDYPTDGIDLNFNTYMPLIARREVEEHTETIDRVDAGCPPSGRRGRGGAGAWQEGSRSHGRQRGRQQEDGARR